MILCWCCYLVSKIGGDFPVLCGFFSDLPEWLFELQQQTSYKYFFQFTLKYSYGVQKQKKLKHFATWFNILAFKQCDLKQWVLKPTNWYIKDNSPMSVHHNCDTLPMSDANAIQGKSLANIFKVIQGYWSVTVVSIGLFWLYFVSFSYKGVIVPPKEL